jgi:threonyl-tRNA synthetase
MATEDKMLILETMRHSASHVMAEAIQIIFPGAKFGIGPAIEDGFYYDFELPRPLVPDDLLVIEFKMREIIAANLPFIKQEVNSAKASDNHINSNCCKNCLKKKLLHLDKGLLLTYVVGPILNQLVR